MSYKIIGDSCIDLPKALWGDKRFAFVPLTLEIGDYRVVDDEQFDQKDFIARVKASRDCPRTACPSPEAFLKAYEAAEADEIYVITLSSHLSGTYQSALIGLHSFEEEHPDSGKRIHVFDSKSASAGELNLAFQIVKYKEAGMDFDTLIQRLEADIAEMCTCFVLESLDVLRKNGRLSGLQAFFATALNIKPVMGSNDGTIIKIGQERGMQKALKNMCRQMHARMGDTSARRLCISHCNCPERALSVQKEMEALGSFAEVVISDTMGVATIYASDGGIVATIL